MKPLNTRAIKVTCVLDPTEIASIPEPKTSRMQLAIRVADSGRTVTADVNAKAVRKAKATISEHGPDGVAAIVQGKLVGDALTEAGLVAQARISKPVEAD